MVWVVQLQVQVKRLFWLKVHKQTMMSIIFLGKFPLIKLFNDWSGNCGNLTAAVGSFAISNGLVAQDRIHENGICTVRIWQANIKKLLLLMFLSIRSSTRNR